MNEPVILVPLDGSEAALAALPIAKVLAEIEQATLRLVHIAASKPPAPELLSRLRLAGPEFDGVTVDTLTGQPAAEILNIAKEIKPHVIVMCNHSSTEPRKVLGRTATEVLRRTSCPLVLVPPDRGLTPWHLHHVLVPHDGTPTTSAALRPAGQIGEHAGAELLVVHVTGLGTSSAEPGSLTTPRYVDQPQHGWPAWSNEFISRLASMCPLGHLHVRMFLAHGNPAAEINRLAEEQSTDLMVVAWRGVWDDPRAPILKNLLGEACCPIMVLRTADIEPLPAEHPPHLDAPSERTMPGKAAVTIDKRDSDAAIFDLDGVLTDTAGIHAAAWKVVFDAFLNRRADRQGLQFRPFEIEVDYPAYVDGRPR